MNITLQETVQNTLPGNDVNVLLTGLGFGADLLDIELAIDEFDQWTNPRNAALIPSSGICTGTDSLERVA
ncbi:hypothetical protein [Actinophytocola oryzae]|uniref:Uncharacterized protein n=1 Tax=Actinophytocola oryzae TaxID=502181 RepID=A0A4R7VVH8_9PSEU|nr:hypothetical protein [Actinophytocola oryzae]TDV53628.1 hypothetical protein CLV71_10496 [Actinophytocola oryzae]